MSHQILVDGKTLVAGAPGALDGLYSALTEAGAVGGHPTLAMSQLEERYRTSIESAQTTPGASVVLQDAQGSTLKEGGIVAHADLLSKNVVITHLPHGLEEVPQNWLVFTAPRPLHGKVTGQGEFLRGRYRAAVDPTDENAEWAIGQNLSLDARVFVSASREELVAMALVNEEYRDRYLNEFQGEALWEVLSGHINDLSGLQLREVQWLRGLALADSALMETVSAVLAGAAPTEDAPDESPTAAQQPDPEPQPAPSAETDPASSQAVAPAVEVQEQEDPASPAPPRTARATDTPMATSEAAPDAPQHLEDEGEAQSASAAVEGLERMAGTVLVEQSQMAEFQKKLDALNKKAARFGLDPVAVTSMEKKRFYRELEYVGSDQDKLLSTLVLLREGQNPPKGEQVVIVNRIALDYPTIKLGDWQVVAKIEALSPGNNVVFTVTGNEADTEKAEQHRSCPIGCEHCNTNRARKESFLLRSAEGDYKEVGSTCIKDFTGIDPAAALFLAQMYELTRLYEGYDEDQAGTFRATAVATESYLANVSFCIEQFGWNSASKARELGIPATYDDAQSLQSILRGDEALTQRYFDSYEQHKAFAQQVIEWYASKEGTDSFERNVKSLLAQPDIMLDNKHLAFSAAAVPAYQRFLNAELTAASRPPSKHLGAEKEKMESVLVVERVHTFEGRFGWQYRINMLDEQGNSLTWKTSSPPDELVRPGSVGRPFEAKFTVKEHEEYQGRKITAVTRLKFEQWVEQTLEERADKAPFGVIRLQGVTPAFERNGQREEIRDAILGVADELSDWDQQEPLVLHDSDGNEVGTLEATDQQGFYFPYDAGEPGSAVLVFPLIDEAQELLRGYARNEVMSDKSEIDLFSPARTLIGTMLIAPPYVPMMASAAVEADASPVREGEAQTHDQPLSEIPAIEDEHEPNEASAQVKWFGTQEKADAFIAKKNMAGTHEVKPVGNRFEVHEIDGVTKAASPEPAQDSRETPAWEMARADWVDQEIRASKYADEYLDDPRAYAIKFEQLSVRWMQQLMERAKTDRVSDTALDDIVQREGIGGLYGFRGVYEAGAAGYIGNAPAAEPESEPEPEQVSQATPTATTYLEYIEKMDQRVQLLGRSKAEDEARAALAGMALSREFGESMEDMLNRDESKATRHRAYTDWLKGEVMSQDAAQPGNAVAFAAHNELAQQYGYTVTPKGHVLKSNGTDTGVYLTEKKGRLRVEAVDGVLFTGSGVASLGKFLESYWYAQKISPAAAQSVANSASEETQVHGARIYKVAVRSGGEVVARWAAQSRDNIGTDKTLGDTLLGSRDEAIAQAERDYAQEQSKQAHLLEAQAQDERERASKAERQADDVRGFIAPGTAPNRAELIRKALDKLVAIEGAAMPTRSHLERWEAQGSLKVSTFEEWKIKDMSRTAHFRATQAEQDAHTRKQQEAGKKTVYLVNDYDLGKTAYDYAAFMLEAQSQQKSVNPATTLDNANPSPAQANVIPDRFHIQVTQALRTLREAELGLSAAERARGANSVGLQTVAEDVREQVDGAHAALARIQAAANRNGVDFTLALEPFGGMPDLARFGMPFNASEQRGTIGQVIASNLSAAGSPSTDALRSLVNLGDEQIQAITEADQAPQTGQYTLPTKPVPDDWEDENKYRPEHPDYQPSPRQLLLINAVREGLETGIYYNKELDEWVGKKLGVPADIRAVNQSRVDGGDFGYDIYMARRYVSAQATSNAQIQARESLALRQGEKLGTLRFNDMKITTNVFVTSLDDSTLSLEGKRGAYVVTLDTDYISLKHAIDRAHEAGKRPDDAKAFVANKAKPVWGAGSIAPGVGDDLGPLFSDAPDLFSAKATAEPDSDDQALARMVIIAADSIEQLRRQDVYRVLEQADSPDKLDAIAAYVLARRPDLRDELSESTADLVAENKWSAATAMPNDEYANIPSARCGRTASELKAAITACWKTYATQGFAMGRPYPGLIINPEGQGRRVAIWKESEDALLCFRLLEKGNAARLDDYQLTGDGVVLVNTQRLSEMTAAQQAAKMVEFEQVFRAGNGAPARNDSKTTDSGSLFDMSNLPELEMFDLDAPASTDAKSVRPLRVS